MNLRTTRRWALLGAALALTAALAPTAWHPASAAEPAVAGSTISGSVTVSGSGAAVSDAQVTSGVRPPAATNASGSYTIGGLSSGDYQLNVRPASLTTVSPTWVYTAGTTLVSVPPDATANFQVAAASATLTGQIALPSGVTDDLTSAGQRAYARAENQEGQGNSVQIAANGSFSIRTLAGPVRLSLWFENPSLAAPITLAGSIFVIADGATASAGTLQVVQKQATISGTVTAGSAPAPANVPVRAWRLDGSEYVDTRTAADGSYSVQVISGTWALRAVPVSDQTYPAAGGSYYVPAQPPQRVKLSSDTASATQNLTIAQADVSVSGTTVDGLSSATPLPPLTTSAVDGRAYALYRDTDGLLRLGPSAPIRDGVFTLRLASTVAVSYTVGANFPVDTPYTGLARPRLTISAATPTQTGFTLPIAADNATISGALKGRTGAAVTGLAGAVYGASNSGGWSRAKVNPLTGQYSMSVVTSDVRGQGGSTWRVRAFVDPTTGYVVQQPRVQRAFLPYQNGTGSSATVDFNVARPDAVVRGRVTRTDGSTGVAGVRVSVRELAADGTTAFDRWVYTDLTGAYRVRVPAGTYTVRANDRAADGRIEPTPQTVTLTTGQTATVDLSFRAADATVTGTVSYNGAPFAALVRARSADGASVTVTAGPAGTFSLRLRQGLSWRLEAVSANDTTFLRSPALTITPVAPTTAIGDLALAASDPLPNVEAFVFDAAAEQSLTLTNGAQILIPAGALADSGDVTLTAVPRTDIASTGGLQPVNFGYRLHAFSGRRPITSFAAPVTLVIPYTDAQLTALGTTPERLVPSYYDEASGSWKPVENVSVVPDGAGGGAVNVTVEHFTDYALLAAPGGAIYLPLARR